MKKSIEIVKVEHPEYDKAIKTIVKTIDILI